MVTLSECLRWNALKFGTAGEVNSKEGRAFGEGWDLAPTNCSEVGIPPVELDGAMGEALIAKPPMQRHRTKLIFDVLAIFDNDDFLSNIMSPEQVRSHSFSPIYNFTSI